jgi:hypothetical protein
MQAKTAGRAAFVREHGKSLFLVRKAAPPSHDEPENEAFSFQTRIAQAASDMKMRWTEPVAAISKRPGNPFPDRISVGRATNCDVVIRLPYVSKLHAHFLVQEDGSLKLVDAGSSQGTAVNGRKLEAGVAQTVKRGDTIRFGYQEVELGDAGRAYDALMAEP